MNETDWHWKKEFLKVCSLLKNTFENVVRTFIAMWEWVKQIWIFKKFSSDTSSANKAKYLKFDIRINNKNDF